MIVACVLAKQRGTWRTIAPFLPSGSLSAHGALGVLPMRSLVFARSLRYSHAQMLGLLSGEPCLRSATIRRMPMGSA